MNKTKPLTILIIEADSAECLKIEEGAANMPEINMISVTNSNHEGVELVEQYLPEAMIYSAAKVFDMALQLTQTKARKKHGMVIESDDKAHMETLEERKERIIQCIEHELDLLGVPRTLKGRVYLVEGIYFLAEVSPIDLKLKKDTVTEHLSKQYGRNGTSMTRTMQTAIKNTWEKSLPEDLQEYYTDRVNYHTGIPTTNEFLRYYAKRIRKVL